MISCIMIVRYMKARRYTNINDKMDNPENEFDEYLDMDMKIKQEKHDRLSICQTLTPGAH